ncbi:MAG TPA: ribbon-helix-helix domain-containing protein [Xanthobacteraceae bacterium]|jgi:predicted DNA-binding ribbon-helix-helix protein|nr:ribbon-helix-helix domain-containing protein [Xanthobacteraceae bacterium]
MKSPVVKRSIVIAGHKTSVSLEDAFWRGLKEIAAARSMTLSDLVASIDTGRDLGNLSSAIRLFVLDHYRSLAAGHAMDDGARTGNGADNHDMMLPRGDVIPLRTDGASFRQNS